MRELGGVLARVDFDSLTVEDLRLLTVPSPWIAVEEAGWRPLASVLVALLGTNVGKRVGVSPCGQGHLMLVVQEVCPEYELYGYDPDPSDVAAATAALWGSGVDACVQQGVLDGVRRRGSLTLS